MNALAWGIVIFGMAAVIIGSCGSFVQMYDHWQWKEDIQPRVEHLVSTYDRDGDGKLSTVERQMMGATEGLITFEYVPGPLVGLLRMLTGVCGIATLALMGVHAYMHRQDIRAWVRTWAGEREEAEVSEN